MSYTIGDGPKREMLGLYLSLPIRLPRPSWRPLKYDAITRESGIFKGFCAIS